MDAGTAALRRPPCAPPPQGDGDLDRAPSLKEYRMSNNSNVKFRLNNSELWGGLIGLGLGIFVIRSGLKLKLATIHDPGPGVVLFYTGILMCAFAAAIIVAALTEGGPTFASRWKDTRWTKPVLVIASLIAFAFALDL